MRRMLPVKRHYRRFAQPFVGEIMKNNRIKKPRRAFFRAALCLIVCLCLVRVPLYSSSAVTVPTGDSMYRQLSDTYSAAIAMDRSRYGLGRYVGGRWTFGCAHLVNMKLMILGVNNRYVGANGKDEYDNYKNLGYDKTGTLYNNKYKVHVYPASKYTVGSALQAIKKECSIATNIVVGFERTNDSAGRIYGHAFYIEGLIGDNVYFTENFTIAYYSEMYFEAGDPVVMSISQCQAYYGRSWFTFEGIIWFEDPALTAAVKEGGYAPSDEDPGYTVNTATAGTYTVVNAGTNGLNLRSGPGTKYESYGRVPNGTTVYVTGTFDGFAKIFYSDSQYALDGWVSVTYLKKKSAIPDIICDYYDEEGYHIARRGYSGLSDAINGAPIGEVTVMTLYSDITVDNDLTIPEGVTVDSNGHKITVASSGSLEVRGGTLISGEAMPVLASDPFTLCEQTDEQYIYRCYFGLKVSGASLEIGDKTAVCFSVSYTSSMMPENSSAEYRLVCENVAGADAVYKTLPAEAGTEDDGSTADYLSFTTDPFSVKYFSDKITCRAEITVTVQGREYTFTSDTLEYSPVDYCMSARGESRKLGDFLDCLMHYAAETQKYFNYSADKLADSAIETAFYTTSDELSAIAIKQKSPPFSSSATKVHINGIRLAVGENVSLVCGTDGALPAGSRLLVWTYGDYSEIEKKAAAAGADTADLLTADTASCVLSPDGDGRFTLPGVSPKQFADTFYFRLEVPDGNTAALDYVMSFSVTAYCSYYLTNGFDDEMDAICLAMCRCCEAARLYFEYEIQ